MCVYSSPGAAAGIRAEASLSVMSRDEEIKVSSRQAMEVGPWVTVVLGFIVPSIAATVWGGHH